MDKARAFLRVVKSWLDSRVITPPQPQPSAAVCVVSEEIFEVDDSFEAALLALCPI